MKSNCFFSDKLPIFLIFKKCAKIPKHVPLYVNTVRMILFEKYRRKTPPFRGGKISKIFPKFPKIFRTFYR